MSAPAAIPGLALVGSADSEYNPAPANIPTTTQRTQALEAESEYRFQASFSRPVTITLLSGIAELFGTELAPNTPYNFRGAKAAISTFYGCELEIKGAVESEIVSKDTTMWPAINLHFALEEARSNAQDTNEVGPRVLLVGPKDTGKTSLAKTLTSYAIKMERHLLFVNMDPKQGVLCMPGSLSATVFSTIIDIEEGWGTSPVSGPTPIPTKLPLVYHYGSEKPGDNPKLFNQLATRLVNGTFTRMSDDPSVRSSGCIIDTPGSLCDGTAEGYEAIQHIISEFSVNIVVVLGSRDVYQELCLRNATKSTGETVKVIEYAASSGCVKRDEQYMRQVRQRQIKEYFYGNENVSLSPFNQTLDFDQLTIFRINTGAPAPYDPAAASPTGQFDEDEDDYEPPPVTVSTDQYEKIEPSLSLQNSIVAVTHAGISESQDDIRNSSIQVYAYVSDVDETKQKIKVLCPMSSRLPPNAILWSSFPESVVDLFAG